MISTRKRATLGTKVELSNLVNSGQNKQFNFQVQFANREENIILYNKVHILEGNIQFVRKLEKCSTGKNGKGEIFGPGLT